MGVVFGPLPAVTLRNASPQLGAGSTSAATTVSVCRAKPGVEATSIGAGDGDLAQWCSAVLPVTGQDLSELGPDDSLVLTVVPLAPGPVTIDGVDLTYTHGGRHGAEHLDGTFTIEV